MKKTEKTTTIDELAIMIHKGFAETATKQDIADMATKQDIADMATKKDIAELAERIGRVEGKLDRALYKEVARLENLVRQLADKMHVKLEY